LKTVAKVSAFAFAATMSLCAQDVVHAVSGTVSKVDSAAKTVAVKSEDGTEHTFHYVKGVTVHGAHDTAKGATDAVAGLKEGSKVAVHYTEIGGKDTAREFDNIGDDGLKATEGTVSKVDKGTKTIAVKTADGTEQTFHMTDAAVKDTGKDAEKAGKVTVYYTEKAGSKTIHFIKRTF